MSSFSNITYEINKINEMIEFERGLAGQDDELEDDAQWMAVIILIFLP